MASKSLQLVREFHEAFGAPVSEEPRLIPEDRAALRVKLIQEELNEYEEALEKGDLVEAADALGDLLVVVYGSMSEHGFDDEIIRDAIHESNMSKLDENGNPIVSDGTDGYPLGKILKGPNYFKPTAKLTEYLEGAL